MPSALAGLRIAPAIATRSRSARRSGHRLPIDLERVDRQALEIGKRRIARPEIVHRDRSIERLELLEHSPRRSGSLLDDRALGKLQHQPVAVKPRGFERAARNRGGSSRTSWTADVHRDIDRQHLPSNVSQWASVRVASLIAKRPSGTIRPDSSATAMKSLGGICPARMFPPRQRLNPAILSWPGGVDQRLEGERVYSASITRRGSVSG